MCSATPLRWWHTSNKSGWGCWRVRAIKGPQRHWRRERRQQLGWWWRAPSTLHGCILLPLLTSRAEQRGTGCPPHPMPQLLLLLSKLLLGRAVPSGRGQAPAGIVATKEVRPTGGAACPQYCQLPSQARPNMGLPSLLLS